MKTAIDKNESEFDRMKRQAQEWLDKDRNHSAPPFLHLALREFKEGQQETAKEVGVIDIAKWLNEKGYRRGMDVYLGEIAGLIKSFIEEHQFTTQRQVTNEEIDKWADKAAILATGKSNYGHIVKAALYTGAIAMRDNKI